MGNEHSRGSSDARDKPEAPQVQTEAELGEQSARTSSSDQGNEVAEAHSDEGNASQTIPQQEEVNSVSPPAEEPGPQERQDNSQEVGQPPSLSQSVSSDKPYESDTAKPPVAEPSSEKAEDATPQIPPEAAKEPDEPGVVPLTTEGPATDPELQPTAKNLHCLAEFIVQAKSCKITPGSPTKETQRLGECSSFEVIIITDATPALVTEQSEAQSSVEAEQRTAEIAGAGSRTAESALLPTGETQAGHSAVDAQTTEGGRDQSSAEIPAGTDSESPVAQQALEVPLASDAVEHTDTNADTKIISCFQENGTFITTMGLEKDHPATATVHDPEAETLPDHLAEPSTDVPQDPDKAKEFSLVKKMDETSSGSDSIEMAEVQAGKLNEHPQTEHVSSTEVTPAAQETRPVATAEAHTQLQDSSSTQKDSMEGPVHARKTGPKFATPFYLCCSDCSIEDGESNAEQ